MQKKYRQKIYYCGDYLEVMVYPKYTKAKGMGKRCKPTSEIQQDGEWFSAFAVCRA